MGEQEEGREGELWLVCKMIGKFKIKKELHDSDTCVD